MGEHADREFGGQHYLAALTATIAVLALPAIGLGGSLAAFLAPVPVSCFLVIFGWRRGNRVVGYAVAGSVLISLLFGSVQALLLPLAFVPSGYVMAAGILGREDPYKAGLKAVLALAAAWTASVMVIGAIGHVNLYGEMLKAIDAGLAQTFESYRRMPDFPVESQAELEQLFRRMRVMVPRIMPGMLAVSAISVVWANMALAGWLLKRRSYPSWPDFKEWRLPEPMVWPLIVAGFLLFAPGWANVAAVNAVLVLLTLFQIQGVAILLHLLERWSVPQPVRLFIFLILIIQAYGIILLSLLGIADIWADFRKPKSNDMNEA